MKPHRWHVEIDTAVGQVYVAVQVTWSDGTQTEIAEWMNPEEYSEADVPQHEAALNCAYALIERWAAATAIPLEP